MTDIISNVILPVFIIAGIILMIWSKISKKPVKELVKDGMAMFKTEEQR